MLPYQSVSRQEDGIVIVGLGGAGANILQRFRGSSAENVRLCIMSLDERLGREVGNVEFIQLGAGLNHGLGSGGDPEMGRMAVEESREEIAGLLDNARLLVMVVGLGGGTGSGVAPVLAEMASQAGVFLVSVLVMPFAFEGRRRRAQADRALEKIASVSDLVFCFENDYMEDLFRTRNGAMAVFEEANSLLSQATASIPMLANSPGIINIGLDELVTALRNNDSRCIYGMGSGYGPRRAEDAARAALDSPLVAFHHALGLAHTVIVHIAGGNSMSLTELRTVMETIRKNLGNEDVNLFFGATVKPRLGEEIRVSLIGSVDAGEFRAAIEAEEAENAAAAAQRVQEPAAPQLPETEETDAEEEVVDEEVVDEEEEEEEVEENEEAAAEQTFAPSPVSRAPITPTAPDFSANSALVTPGVAVQAPSRSVEIRPRAAAEPVRQSQQFTTPPAVGGQTAPVPPAQPREQASVFAGDGSQGFFNLDGHSVSESHAKNIEEEYDEQVRRLFSDDAPQTSSRASLYYSPEASRRRRMADDEAEEKDFSLRYNDLRDMFPE